MEPSNLQFERYDAQRGRVTPIISFNQAGNIYFSAGLTKKYFKSGETPVCVALYFDQKNELIALKLLKEIESGMVSLKAGHTGGAFINTKAFAIKYSLMSGAKLKDVYVGQYYPIEETIQGIGKVLLVNLKEKK